MIGGIEFLKYDLQVQWNTVRSYKKNPCLQINPVVKVHEEPGMEAF